MRRIDAEKESVLIRPIGGICVQNGNGCSLQELAAGRRMRRIDAERERSAIRFISHR
jgi:hypothetical protein